MFSLFLLSDKLRKVIATLEMFPTQRTLKSVIMTGDTEVVKESGEWMCKQNFAEESFKNATYQINRVVAL